MVLFTVLIISSSASASYDNFIIELDYRFEEVGYIYENIGINDTIVLNQSNCVKMTPNVKQGNHFTVVIAMNESFDIFDDYEEYRSSNSSVYIFENVEYGPREYNFGHLLPSPNSGSNGSTDPYKFLMILYYKGLGVGIINIQMELSTATIDFGPIIYSSEPVDYLFYPSSFLIPLMLQYRKIRK